MRIVPTPPLKLIASDFQITDIDKLIVTTGVPNVNTPPVQTFPMDDLRALLDHIFSEQETPWAYGDKIEIYMADSVYNHIENLKAWLESR